MEVVLYFDARDILHSIGRWVILISNRLILLTSCYFRNVWYKSFMLDVQLYTRGQALRRAAGQAANREYKWSMKICVKFLF